MNRKDLKAVSSEALRGWLNNHVAALEAGVNVGQIDRNKAQAFRLELSRRGAQ